MKKIFISNKLNRLRINGTSFVGHIHATYAQLVEVFGEPNFGPNGQSGDGKITCSWYLEFNNEIVATIYDWKTPHTPMNSYDWHVGGKEKLAFECVLDYYNSHQSNHGLTNLSLHNPNNKKN